MTPASLIQMFNTLSALTICRASVAFVWFYHGLVPKLLGPHEDELAIVMSLGVSQEIAARLAIFAGVGELVMAGLIVLYWRHRWPLQVTAISMVGLLLVVAFSAPNLLVGAFNPVTTNLSVLALALVALKLHTERDKIEI